MEASSGVSVSHGGLVGVLGAFLGVLGASWARLGVVWRPSRRRMEGAYGVSSSVAGRLGASSEGLRPDFHTKLKHSMLELVFYRILQRFVDNSNTCKSSLVLQK